MAKSRYKNRQTIDNRSDLIKDRPKKRIKHYTTSPMSYPTEKVRKTLVQVTHIWSHGDKYWKLAANHYNDPKYWWVIAWYNLKPTDAHCKIGDTIIIPKPLNKILKYYGY